MANPVLQVASVVSAETKGFSLAKLLHIQPVQVVLGLMPIPALALQRQRLLQSQGSSIALLPCVLIGLVSFLIPLMLLLQLIEYQNSSTNAPYVAAMAVFGVASAPQLPLATGFFASIIAFLAMYGLGLFTANPHDVMSPQELPTLYRMLSFRKKLAGLIQSIFTLGISLLPLSALLLMVPAIMPDESVLSDTVKPVRSNLKRLLRRISAMLTGIALLVALLAFSIEVVSKWNPPSGYFNKLVPASLESILPETLVNQWPYALLIIYGLDLILLFGIGKVPLQYNYRNLVVRWKITALTALAFFVVTALLTFLLAYVNGITKLTENSGIPGNVFVLSEGATDELFSNLGYGEIGNLKLERAKFVDQKGKPIEIRVKQVEAPNSKEKVYLCSNETYFVINQPVPKKPGEPERRRFAQLRGLEDGWIAGQVHGIDLVPGGRWFDSTPINENGMVYIPAVIGEGAASKFGDDVGKGPLVVGDTFTIGDLPMKVVGVMKSEGSTFGSEVWAPFSVVGKKFGKESYTTIVLRIDRDEVEASRAFAKFISNNFKSPRLSAKSEMDYFEELGKSNQQLLFFVIVIALIMAIGGVFGVMNTMYAAIAQRTKDIGVMRILGFKRWQILVSFMLESFCIAIVGGILGVLAGSIADGYEVTSNVSSGQGGGKTVVLRMVVDTTIISSGILFTIMMGRLGGLVPSLSAMRLGILESLR